MTSLIVNWDNIELRTLSERTVIKVKLTTLYEGDPEAPFWIANPFLGLLQFTLDPYLIMLSVKVGSNKYHFVSLWYDLTLD